MAIYRLESRIISRGSGHSAVAAAAYRTGTKIRDERSNRIHDYSSRHESVVESAILRPENSPEWSARTASLWNMVEGEKRKDAQLAREFILAVPRELSTKEQFELAADWVQSNLVSKGMIVEVSLHLPKDKKNPHIHALCTMRTIEGDKFSAKKPREWNDKALLLHQRESWAEAVNHALKKAGRPERVDHRSLADRGLDLIPQPKIGKEAMGMKRRGILDDPERFKLVRKVGLMNSVRPLMRAIQKHGEIRHVGMGTRFWDRSLLFISWLRERASGVVKGTWAKLLDAHRTKRDKNGPDITM